MQKKGQAAMEFLMTYGWAILVVLAAIAALAYFGVLNPDRFLPEKCTLPSGIACLDVEGSTSSITMSIQNAQGIDMANINLSLVDTTASTEVQCTGSTSLSNGAKAVYTCSGSSNFSTGKLNNQVRIIYTNSQTALNHTKTGELILKI
ncbi:hypothetical protein H6504_03655 [Candidatus Woesearchaeota archaeon]|nr:hypothetical protein [Candidatus Woesearchaeota archaeon]